jgi:hypothetical protein
MEAHGFRSSALTCAGRRSPTHTADPEKFSDKLQLKSATTLELN